MKELIVISGKGGTGKTSLVASFASLAENKVLCDADVDAADLHLIMNPKVKKESDKKLMALPEAERNKQMDKSRARCICKVCPSYTGTNETKVLFCGVGKSSVISEEKGCTCGVCPVVAHMGLTRLYYCTRGSEREQRGL